MDIKEYEFKQRSNHSCGSDCRCVSSPESGECCCKDGDDIIGDAYTVEPDGSHKATVHYGFCMSAYELEKHCHDCFALEDCIAMARKDGIVVRTPQDNVV